jgi:hypothetical protein
LKPKFRVDWGSKLQVGTGRVQVELSPHGSKLKVQDARCNLQGNMIAQIGRAIVTHIRKQHLRRDDE